MSKSKSKSKSKIENQIKSERVRAGKKSKSDT